MNTTYLLAALAALIPYALWLFISREAWRYEAKGLKRRVDKLEAERSKTIDQLSKLRTDLLLANAKARDRQRGRTIYGQCVPPIGYADSDSMVSFSQTPAPTGDSGA